MRAVNIVQQLFLSFKFYRKFYCMFYCSCDQSLRAPAKALCTDAVLYVTNLLNPTSVSLRALSFSIHHNQFCVCLSVRMSFWGLNISETKPDNGMVPMDSLQESGNGL